MNITLKELIIESIGLEKYETILCPNCIVSERFFENKTIESYRAFSCNHPYKTRTGTFSHMSIIHATGLSSTLLFTSELSPDVVKEMTDSINATLDIYKVLMV